MPFPLEREQIQQLTEELESVIAAHLTWFKQLNKTLLFGCDTLASDLAPDAHLLTPFGQWLHSDRSAALSEHADLHLLSGLHKEMHAVASRLHRHCRDGGLPAQDDYNRCIDLSLKLNTHLRHLQLEVIGELLATDTLTGAFTRRGMITKLQGEQERALRIQRPCCLCLLDFDRFKRVNDELGHPAGDAVLRQGMKFAMGVLRKYDSVYRYGGEEFLICLPGTPISDARQVIERIRGGLQALDILLPSGKVFHATASFGLSELDPRKPVQDSIERADQALLRAKENGRNRLELG